MEEVKVGDIVYGANGQPLKITGVFPANTKNDNESSFPVLRRTKENESDNIVIEDNNYTISELADIISKNVMKNFITRDEIKDVVKEVLRDLLNK